MIQIGQLKGETIWDVITRLEELLLPKAKSYPSFHGAVIFHEIHFE